MLSQLVSPPVCRSFAEGIRGLRTWQQGLQRAGEIQATLPDASLLLKGVDGATAGLLAAHPMIGFRVNAFRHQLAIDYNPTVASVVQLVRLIQAECEAGSITLEGEVEKKAKAAALKAAREQANPKVPPVPPPSSSGTQLAALGVGQGEPKAPNPTKGKGKGDEGLLCHKFNARDADLGIDANLSMIVRELEKKPGVWPVANRDICARSVLWWHRRIEWCPRMQVRRVRQSLRAPVKEALKGNRR